MENFLRSIQLSTSSKIFNNLRSIIGIRFENLHRSISNFINFFLTMLIIVIILNYKITTIKLDLLKFLIISDLKYQLHGIRFENLQLLTILFNFLLTKILNNLNLSTITSNDDPTYSTFNFTNFLLEKIPII